MSAATTELRAHRLRCKPHCRGHRTRCARLRRRYGDVAPETADVIVALGGDGFMLQTLHTLHDVRQADLRHASRHRRLPDERVSARTICASGLRRRSMTVIHPLLDARARRRRPHARVPRLQRGVAVPPDLSGGAAAHPDRRQGAAGRAGRRRRAAGDAGGIDGLQSLGAGPDHPDQRAADGAHPDQPVPAAALAWRAPARQRARAGRGAASRQAPGRRGRRPRRGARRASRSTSRWITASRRTLLFDPGHSLDERILREQFGI